jgi:chromosome segregation ATPase
MQNLNEKISAYKTKISDTQLNLNELNSRLEVTRHNYLLKQSEMERKQRELAEHQQSLARLRHEKGALGERQSGLRMELATPQSRDG